MQRHCSLPRGKVLGKWGRINTTQNYFLYFSALKQANRLQDLSKHPHEESLSETPTILWWKRHWKGFKLWTAFLFQVLMKPITPKQLRCFLIFLIFAERVRASQNKRNICYCKAQLFLLLPLAKQQIAACPNKIAAPHKWELVPRHF